MQIVLKAESEGLKSADVIIEAMECEPKAFVP